jgi:anti-sigma factor (TIGR02949 family)
MTESPRNPLPSAGECGPDCQAVLQRLWEFLDGELCAEDSAAFHAHLAMCSKCYPQYNFEKAFLDALAQCQCQRCAPHELRAKVFTALRSEGFTPV